MDKKIAIHIAEPNINVLVYDDYTDTKTQYKFNIFDKLLIDKFIKFFDPTIAYYVEDNLIHDYYPVILVFTKKNNLIVFKYGLKEKLNIFVIEDLNEIKLEDKDINENLQNDDILENYKVDYIEALHNSIQGFILENEEITKDLI